MPIATLKYPRSMTTRGIIFIKGISQPISDAIANELVNDPRFEIKGLAGDRAEDRARLSVTSGGRPHVRAVRLEMIRNANDTLDPDVTDNYEANGLPSIAGLARAMGWTPDEGEIREALRLKRRSGVLGSDGDAAVSAKAFSSDDEEEEAPVADVMTASETTTKFAEGAHIEPQSVADTPGKTAEQFAEEHGRKKGIAVVRKPRAPVDTTQGAIELA